MGFNDSAPGGMHGGLLGFMVCGFALRYGGAGVGVRFWDGLVEPWGKCLGHVVESSYPVWTLVLVLE